jgi:hypothetical protein
VIEKFSLSFCGERAMTAAARDESKADKKRKHELDGFVEPTQDFHSVELEIPSDEEVPSDGASEEEEADEFPEIDVNSDSEIETGPEEVVDGDEEESEDDGEDETDGEDEDEENSQGEDEELHIFPKSKTITSEITGQPKRVFPEIDPEYDSDSSTEDVMHITFVHDSRIFSSLCTFRLQIVSATFRCIGTTICHTSDTTLMARRSCALREAMNWINS